MGWKLFGTIDQRDRIIVRLSPTVLNTLDLDFVTELEAIFLGFHQQDTTEVTDPYIGE